MAETIEISKQCPTAKNTVISPDFLVWKLWRKTQFPHSFWQIPRNYAETMPFRKISTPGNQVKLRYFSQCPLQRGIRYIDSLPRLDYFASKTCSRMLEYSAGNPKSCEKAVVERRKSLIYQTILCLHDNLKVTGLRAFAARERAN